MLRAMPGLRSLPAVRAWWLAAALLGPLLLQAAPSAASSAEPGLAAPNRVDISPRLVTAGQPPASTLEQLRILGFDAVIYLAPLDVPGAVVDEPTIVERQGLRFVNIPIRFNRPDEQHYATFVAAMKALEGRKVLVHCQVNMRASSMVFLYRSIEQKEPPDRAYEAVTAIWSPDGVWKAFIDQTLERHGVRFETY